VRIASAIDLREPTLNHVLETSAARLEGRGRLVVRPSGTEPLIRVMVEADDQNLLEEVLSTVTQAIEREAIRA
jgi:phosphoglucosamine mutase